MKKYRIEIELLLEDDPSAWVLTSIVEQMNTDGGEKLLAYYVEVDEQPKSE